MTPWRGALFLLCLLPCQAQNPVHWTAQADIARPLHPGDSFVINLTAQIDKGWHMYSITQGPGGPFATSITVPANQGIQVTGAITGPPPHVEMDPNFGINTETHQGSPTFHLPAAVSGNTVAGVKPIVVRVQYQACDDSQCLPPRTERLNVPVMLAAGMGASATPPPPTPANPSMLSFIWLAMSVGALSLLTPCVFPMVPITVSYFTKHAAGRRSTAVRDAGIYALGIILTFTALGVALAVVFGAAGINRFAASPWINLAITAIFVGFALSLFGAFEIGLPSGFVNRLDQIARGRESSKVIGLLLMGLTFSLTSFTCTAPFVGTLLVMASQGRWTQPVIGMLAFSSVFAFPFFLLALAPQLVSQLPRSGGWLNSVKVVMGLLEIAAAMKFLSNADLIWRWGLFTRGVVLAVWISIGLLTVLYILGYFKLAHDSALEHVSALRLMTAMAFLAVTVALVPGLFGQPLGELDSFLPPSATELTTPMGPRAVADGSR